MQLLKEHPLTGREIIRTANEQSKGKWTPSPGLVYPLLGRLVVQGLIEEAESGGYFLSVKGIKELDQMSKIKQDISEQYDIFTSLGITGKFLVSDVIDRIISLTKMAREDIDRLGKNQRTRYYEFLKAEVRRLEKENTHLNNSNDSVHQERNWQTQG
jgi:DNA-binding PadR family transcriptional regulator|tara:strand:- start:2184 stop:2654 length:471 start_codon:yes stop_codon:yes gene_type:complete